MNKNLEILKEFDIWFVGKYYGDDRMLTEVYDEIQKKIKLLIESNTPKHTRENIHFIKNSDLIDVAKKIKDSETDIKENQDG